MRLSKAVELEVDEYLARGADPDDEVRVRVECRLPELPQARLFESVGKVNSGPVGPAGPGSLMFTGAKAERSGNSWDLGLDYSYRRSPWGDPASYPAGDLPDLGRRTNDEF